MMEERLALIDGVHTRGKEGAQGGSNKEESSGGDGQTKIVTFVLIPADAAMPLRELRLNLPNGSEGNNDPFLNLLVPYFRLQPGEKVDVDLLNHQSIAAREAGCDNGYVPTCIASNVATCCGRRDNRTNLSFHYGQ